ncbi:MAG: hypothetical protein HC890_19140, partial [Chloroflexaceae bacterium]|nr:hypothetical protein [Chloroflexaceae bacterium]
MKVFSLSEIVNDWLASRGIKPSYVIGLDSATAAVQATAHFLHGKEWRQGGFAPALAAQILDLISQLP